MASDDLLHVALAALDQLAAAGDNKARHAGAILRGRSGGRPAIDDTAALAKIEALVVAGKTRATAINTVARLLTPDPRKTAAIAARLRKKVARNRFCACIEGVRHRSC